MIVSSIGEASLPMNDTFPGYFWLQERESDVRRQATVSAKIFPRKINAQKADVLFFHRDLSFRSQLRLAKADEVFVIAEHPANFRAKRMNAALVFVHVIKNTGSAKTGLLLQVFAQLFRNGFQLLMYVRTLLFRDRNRTAAQAFATLAWQCIHKSTTFQSVLCFFCKE